MKYCTECGSEYQDAIAACADDGNTELVSIEEMRKRGLPTVEERDTRKFVRAGTADDPLSAERFSQVLEEQRIPVFARPRRTGTVDGLTGATVQPWWELLVPEDHLDRATALLLETRREMEADAEENAKAAEAEALGDKS